MKNLMMVVLSMISLNAFADLNCKSVDGKGYVPAFSVKMSNREILLTSGSVTVIGDLERKSTSTYTVRQDYESALTDGDTFWMKHIRILSATEVALDYKRDTEATFSDLYGCSGDPHSN